MFKNYRMMFLSLFFILFFIMIVSILWVNSKVADTKKDEVSDNILLLFRHELEIQKSNALFLSVSLSGDKELKEALLEDEEDLGYELLINKLNTLKQYTFIKDVRTQLLTKDLYIFARSWDNTYAGMPLEAFREDLQLIKKVRKPKVSIDPGRLLTIKATTPVYHDKDLIGYTEAIKTFEGITRILRKRGIELTILMDDDFLDVATLMRDNPSIGAFIISNKNYSIPIASDLATISSQSFEQENYIETGKYLHVLDVMRDSAGEKIGYYVLSVAEDRLEAFEKIKDNISFFINVSKNDLYTVVESQELGSESYHDSENNALDMSLRGALQSYTKEELINIILEKNYPKKIKGKIR